MTIFVEHEYSYELQRIVRMFFFDEKIVTLEGKTPKDFQGKMICATYEDGFPKVVYGEMDNGSGMFATELLNNKLPIHRIELELEYAILAYGILSQMTGLHPPWGVLTGIRPVKLFIWRMREGMNEEDLHNCFVKKRRLDESRFSLALQTAKIELPILDRSTSDSFSLYVSIPFCPSRCSYCSFVSHSIEHATKLIPDYVDKLCEELILTAQIAKTQHLRLRTIYFGGGTPTSLSAEQLEKLMNIIAKYFNLQDIWEYTVEAGRPDTITPQKLQVIQKYGAGRVSINPQTLSDSVLQAIGRKHTVAQCMESYQLAKNMGFSVNMDLIAGLPTDSQENFEKSVDGVIEASPDNITIHTLTVKRAANLSAENAKAQINMVRTMTDSARLKLDNAGYQPYYLYRQSGTLSALENVGYAKPGTECLYNIYMMDETHSVFAVGAGASTRLCHPLTRDIKRIYNYKYPYEYLEHFDEIKKRREQITAFLL